MNIWALCEGSKYIQPMQLEPWRVVEAQHILSARDLVDTIEEHNLLEELIENSKPSIEKNKDYLIFTPFRYPPLKYGSRFGRTFEPSLWYGSLEAKTAFTEVAYYRLQFFKDSTADLGYVELTMTAFTASIMSKICIDLTKEPFSDYTSSISDKSSHQVGQLLGSNMREENIEVFTYYSARTHEKTKNVAVFTKNAFHLKKNQYVSNQQNWKCLSNKHLIEFTRIDISGKKTLSFSEKYFL